MEVLEGSYAKYKSLSAASIKTIMFLVLWSLLYLCYSLLKKQMYVVIFHFLIMYWQKCGVSIAVSLISDFMWSWQSYPISQNLLPWVLTWVCERGGKFFLYPSMSLAEALVKKKKKINTRKTTRSLLTCTLHVYVGDTQGKMHNCNRWLRIET